MTFSLVLQYLPGDTRQWSLLEGRTFLSQLKNPEKYVRKCLYRPFDHRFIFYHTKMVDWHRPEILGNMLHSNLALLANRQSKESFAVFCSTSLTERKIAAAYDASSTFPLYLYPSNESLFAQPSDAPSGRRPNLCQNRLSKTSKLNWNLGFIPDGRGDLSATFGPEDVFYYLYAVLHSPTYRSCYAEFLKIDFPRIPLTSDRGLFAELCEKGKTLSDLHLMKTRGTHPANFPEDGNNIVDKPKFHKERVYINKTQWFGNVPEQVWNFYVGGYQVLHKWLKDRKGRELSYDDTQHYRYVVAALAATIDLMEDIDASIDAKGGFPLS